MKAQSSKFFSLISLIFVLVQGVSFVSHARAITGEPFAINGLDPELSGMEDLSFAPDEAPKAAADILRMDKKYFVIYYSTQLRLPQVSAYVLTADHLRSAFVKRKDRFHADDELKTLGQKPVLPTDYLNSGYDRGHMAPSGDFTWSEEANDTTFLMSNMAPQKPNLNRKAWEQLETHVRLWACAAQSVIVLTGPILTTPLTKTKTGVVIPQKFFKIIVDKNPPLKAIGFVMNQDDSAANTYKTSHMPIKDIEQMAGLHFFDQMSQADRDTIENDDNLDEWDEEDCKASNLQGPPSTTMTTVVFLTAQA